MRTRSKWLTALLLVLVIAVPLTGCGNHTTIVTGTEWFLKQEPVIENVGLLLGDMDEVVALYVSGGIDAAAFSAEIDIKKAQYNVLRNEYNASKQEMVIKEGSHSYASRVGSEAVDDLILTVGEMVEGFQRADGSVISPNEAAYVYIGFQQVVKDEFASYSTAAILISGITESS